jgi:hypothetical protein
MFGEEALRRLAGVPVSDGAKLAYVLVLGHEGELNNEDLAIMMSLDENSAACFARSSKPRSSSSAAATRGRRGTHCPRGHTGSRSVMIAHSFRAARRLLPVERRARAAG